MSASSVFPLEEILGLLTGKTSEPEHIKAQKQGDAIATQLLLRDDISTRNIGEILFYGAIIATLNQKKDESKLENVMEALDGMWFYAKLRMIETLHDSYHAIEEARDKAADKPETLTKLPKPSEALSCSFFGSQMGGFGRTSGRLDHNDLAAFDAKQQAVGEAMAESFKRKEAGATAN